MATKPASNPVAEARPVQKGKMMLFLTIGLIVLALAAGGAWFLISKKKAHDEEDGDDAAEPVKKVQVDHSHPPVFVPLEPFTVNLQPENGEQYLQVVLNFRVTDTQLGEEVKQYMPEIRHHILMLLSAKKASEVSTVGGREALAGQICTESNKVLGADLSMKKKASTGCDGPIVAVLFTSFIVQ
jgi:flagellar FliL protein